MEIVPGKLYKINTLKGWYTGVYNETRHNVYNGLIALNLGDIVLSLSKEIVYKRHELLSTMIQPLVPRPPRVAYNFLYKNMFFYDIYDAYDPNMAGFHIQEDLSKI